MPKALTQEKFILKSIEKHGIKYDYSQSIYINCRTKVKIICPNHGEFYQKPLKHISGKYGCNRCGGTGKYTQDQFIKKCHEIHGEKYCYKKTIYKDIMSKILITCKIHGDFFQSASEHIRGSGCKPCSTMYSGFGKQRFINSCEKNKGFGIIYLLECKSDNESFYKIGITSREIKDRTDNIPYNCEIISCVESSAINIFMSEKKIHKKLKEYSYTPEIFFFGRTECFQG